MDIFVVSRGRHTRCITLESLGNLAPYPVSLVVHKSEESLYEPLAEKHGVELVGLEYDGIAQKRSLIGTQLVSANRFLMLDDDIVFYRRKSKKDWHLRKLEEHEPIEMIALLGGYLRPESPVSYAHAGVSAREGQNRLRPNYENNTRYMRVLGYRTEDYLQCEHNRVRFMEDFDVNLQLLRKGLKSIVFTNFAQNQSGTQAKGGCSNERTNETHSEAAQKLAELHAPFVKLRQKQNKTGGEFGNRLEVTVSWKAAFASAQKQGTLL